ncbi:hypothetical protein MASR2M15_13140 [Anaerolineales bacterium]
MTQSHRTKEETRQLILDAVYLSKTPLTRTQIARTINRTKTPHLIQIIDELVEQELLIQDHDQLENGVQAYVYKIHPAHLP